MKAIKYWLEDYWPVMLVAAVFGVLGTAGYYSEIAPGKVRVDAISGTQDKLVHCRAGVHLVQISASDAGVIYRCVP